MKFIRKKEKKILEPKKTVKKEKKVNKKILESKRIIKEEKQKIRLEKKNIRKKKIEKFKNNRVGRFLGRIFSFIKIDKENYSFSEVFGITLISLVVGAFACFSVFTVITGGRNYLKLSKELNKFVDVYETLVDNYYDEIDKDELIEEAIDGMVSSVGDVYTSYVDPDEIDEFNELVSGVYEGIGCSIQLQEDGVKVVEVFEDGPADKGGLKVDDIIVKVDDVNASDVTVDELSNYIKTSGNGKLKMIVSRNGEEKKLTVKRDKVETPVVKSAVYEKNDKSVGYLNISLFSAVAASQFEDKLEELEKKNIDALVIDVRANNGGYLSTVTDILNMLLPKGSVVYQIEKEEEREVTKDKTSESRSYPIAVLVDGGSASASEILAGAIKESYKGFVVGSKTFGKGTVQQVKTLTDGSMIKYTIENWLTPDGNWIDGVGIEPTDEVMLTEEFYNNPIVENDSQLQKALELVSE